MMHSGHGASRGGGQGDVMQSADYWSKKQVMSNL